MNEKRIVPGYEWLTVDRCGNIWNTYTKYKLKPHKVKEGYLKANTTVDNIRVKCFIHRAVALAFILNPNNLPTVNHLDADKTNNYVENLEWASHKRQTEHVKQLDLQTYVRGEDIGNSKYTEKTVRKVCKLLEDGYRNCDIVRLCDVSRSLPSDIRNGNHWIHISKEYNIKPKRRGKLSVETVMWVCSKLQEGLTPQEILKLSTNKNVALGMIYHIKNRETFKDISKDYSF